MRINIFTKIVFIIILLLIPIIVVYHYSNQVTVQVVREELKASNLNKLSFLLSQAEGQMNRLSTDSLLMSDDPALLELQLNGPGMTTYERQKMVRMLQSHIMLQTIVGDWLSNIKVYLPDQQQIYSTESEISFNKDQLGSKLQSGWQYVPFGDSHRFIWYSVSPAAGYADPDAADSIVEVSFDEYYLRMMLELYKADGKGDPFLFKPGTGTIVTHSANMDHVNTLITQWNQQGMKDIQKEEIVELNGQQYVASYLKSRLLGWYLVDYIPLQEMLGPITKSKNLFYMSTGLLLLLGIIASFLLYRHVLVPIRRLSNNVQRIKRGEYSARIIHRGHHEFTFLFNRFNEMAHQIQELVERVYVERIRSRDATLKHLQSQINPHFLYNCLFFIKSKASLGDEDAVVEMSLNLGEYFRYTTRSGNDTGRLEDEIKLITNYLKIQNMRMRRFEFAIDIPAGMMGLQIPRLLLQPLVENAVIHGVESREGLGYIKVWGVEGETDCQFIVEDNGAGMETDKLEALKQKLLTPLDDEMGCGLWNVNQRLLLKFGEGSGLWFEPSELGGLKVTLQWRKAKEEGN